MIFMKKRIAHNNINIFHSHENKTQKNPQTYVSYLKTEKMEGKVLQENRKKKKINTYIVQISCLQEITICLSEIMHMSLFLQKKTIK